eukprot:gene20065-26052_t
MDSKNEKSKTPKRNQSLLNWGLETIAKFVSPLSGSRNENTSLELNNDENTNDNSNIPQSETLDTSNEAETLHKFDPLLNNIDVKLTYNDDLLDEAYNSDSNDDKENKNEDDLINNVTIGNDNEDRIDSMDISIDGLHNNSSTIDDLSPSLDQTFSTIKQSTNEDIRSYENISSNVNISSSDDISPYDFGSQLYNNVPLNEYKYFELKKIATTLGVNMPRRVTKVTLIDMISSELNKTIISNDSRLISPTKSARKSTPPTSNYRLRSSGVKTRHKVLHFPVEYRSPPGSRHKRTRVSNSAKKTDVDSPEISTPVPRIKRRKATPYKNIDASLKQNDSDDDVSNGTNDDNNGIKEDIDEDNSEVIDDNNEVNEDNDQHNNEVIDDNNEVIENVNLEDKFIDAEVSQNVLSSDQANDLITKDSDYNMDIVTNNSSNDSEKEESNDDEYVNRNIANDSQPVYESANDDNEMYYDSRDHNANETFENDLFSTNNTVKSNSSNTSSHTYDDETAEENHYADEEDGEGDEEGDESVVSDVNNIKRSNIFGSFSIANQSIPSLPANSFIFSNTNTTVSKQSIAITDSNNVIDLIDDDDDDFDDNTKDNYKDDMDIGYLNEENYSDDENSENVITKHRKITTQIRNSTSKLIIKADSNKQFDCNITTTETADIKRGLSSKSNEQSLTTITEKNENCVVSNSPTTVLRKAALEVASTVMNKLSGRLLKVMTGVSTNTPDNEKVRLTDFEYSLFHRLLEESKPLSSLKPEDTSNLIEDSILSTDKSDAGSNNNNIRNNEPPQENIPLNNYVNNETSSVEIISNNIISTPFHTPRLDLSINRSNELLRRLNDSTSKLLTPFTTTESAAKSNLEINRPWIPRDRHSMGSTPFRPLLSVNSHESSLETPLKSILEKRSNESIYDNTSDYSNLDRFGPSTKKILLDRSNESNIPVRLSATPNNNIYQSRLLIPQLSGMNSSTYNRRASVDSYTPAFRDESLKLSADKKSENAISGISSLNTLGRGRRQSLSFLQRRKLEKQQENVGSAIVAKRILESLSELTTPLDEHRLRPKSKSVTWIDNDETSVSSTTPVTSTSLAVSNDNSLIDKTISSKPSVTFDETTTIEKDESSKFIKPTVQTPFKFSSNKAVNESENVERNITSQFKFTTSDKNDEFYFHPSVTVTGVDNETSSFPNSDSSYIKYSFSPPNTVINKLNSKPTNFVENKTNNTTNETKDDTSPSGNSTSNISKSSNPWAALSDTKDKIKCIVCLVSNNKSATKCVSCESTLNATQAQNKSTENKTLGGSKDSITSIWNTISDKIKCLVCLVPNEKSATKCVSCENDLSKSEESKSKQVESTTSSTDTSTWGASVATPAQSKFIFGSVKVDASATSADSIKPPNENSNSVDSSKPSNTFTGFNFGSSNKSDQKSSFSTMYQQTIIPNPLSTNQQSLNSATANSTKFISTSSETSFSNSLSTSAPTSSTTSLSGSGLGLTALPNFDSSKKTAPSDNFGALPTVGSSNFPGFTFGSTKNDTNIPNAFTSPGFSFNSKLSDKDLVNSKTVNEYDEDVDRKSNKRRSELSTSEDNKKPFSNTFGDTVSSAVPLFQFGNSSSGVVSTSTNNVTSTFGSTANISNNLSTPAINSEDSKVKLDDKISFGLTTPLVFGSSNAVPTIASVESTASTITTSTTTPSFSFSSISNTTNANATITPITSFTFSKSVDIKEQAPSSAALSNTSTPFVFGNTQSSNLISNPTNRTASPVEFTSKRLNTTVPDSPGSTMDMGDSNIGIPLVPNTAPVSTTAVPFTFGATSTPFSFGNTGIGSAPLNSSALPNNPFSANTNPVTTTGFGNTHANPFGGPTSSTFSGFGNSSNTPSNPIGNNPFGGQASNQNIFGSTNNASIPTSFGVFGSSNAIPSNPFGSPSGANSNQFPPIPGPTSFNMGTIDNSKANPKRKIVKAKRPERS